MAYGYMQKSNTMIVEFRETVPEEQKPRSLLVHLGNLSGVLEFDSGREDNPEEVLVYLGGQPVRFRMTKDEFYARLLEVMQR